MHHNVLLKVAGNYLFCDLLLFSELKITSVPVDIF